MSSARTKKTRSSPKLTADRVRRAALRLIETDGLDGFSTRKLGRALGVEAMAIYWYYSSKDALLDAVVDLLVEDLDAAEKQDPAPADFIDALRRLAHAYRGLADAYPNAFPLLATRRFATRGAYRFLDELFALAEAHGLDARTTARFYWVIASYANGIALAELAGVREVATRREADAARAELPRVADVFGWLAPEHHDEVFSFGLELILDAVRAHTKTSPGARRATPARPRRARSVK